MGDDKTQTVQKIAKQEQQNSCKGAAQNKRICLRIGE
jgi:hypothetical protein